MDTTPINERTIEDWFVDALEQEELWTTDWWHPEPPAARVARFADTGIMTRNHGIVLYLDDGSEFQITIVQSKFGSRYQEDDSE